MFGKILKIVSNDLNGNVDDRKVVVFACFEHIKYGNNYVIFAFEGEYGKKKLGYGSVFLKDNSIVIFSVKDNIKSYIDEFLMEFNMDKMNKFRILDISKIQKVELVSYSDMDYDNLQLLENKSIVSNNSITKEVEKDKKPIFLYLLLILLVLFAVGVTILYLNPELFTIKYKQLVCTNNLYDQNIELYYDIEKDIKFDKKDKVDSIDVVKIYNFLESDLYYTFKENNLHNEYFKNGELYKYMDDGLNLKVMYEEKSIIDDYEEMYTYMVKEGFVCVEKDYEK